MCYASPGPRCSKHALTTLNNLRERYREHLRKNEEVPQKLLDKMHVAQEEYDSTPKGQEDLEIQLEDHYYEDENEENQELAERLERGQALRRVKLAAWKEFSSHHDMIRGTAHDLEEDPYVTEDNFIDQEKYRNIKKMPALFVIDREKHQATTAINENAAWIFSEPSKATIKRDGTSITITDDGKVFARRSVRKGKQAPPGYIVAEVDSYTGHSFGLEPIEQSTFKKIFNKATEGKTLTPGTTYELCGPKVNGNSEGLQEHTLMPHGEDIAEDIPDMRTMPREEAYEKLKEIFTSYKERGIEGVVWWGENGKRTKLRVKDFFGDPNRR